MDMVGRGDRDEVAVLGIRQNPELDELLDRAADLKRYLPRRKGGKR